MIYIAVLCNPRITAELLYNTPLFIGPMPLQTILVVSYSSPKGQPLRFWRFSSGIRAMWLNREKHRAWTLAERCGCPVVHITSLFRTRWYYHLIPDSFRKHKKTQNVAVLNIVSSSGNTAKLIIRTYV